jgi:hypothetical protein
VTSGIFSLTAKILYKFSRDFIWTECGFITFAIPSRYVAVKCGHKQRATTRQQIWNSKRTQNDVVYQTVREKSFARNRYIRNRNEIRTSRYTNVLQMFHNNNRYIHRRDNLKSPTRFSWSEACKNEMQKCPVPVQPGVRAPDRQTFGRHRWPDMLATGLTSAYWNRTRGDTLSGTPWTADTLGLPCVNLTKVLGKLWPWVSYESEPEKMSNLHWGKLREGKVQLRNWTQTWTSGDSELTNAKLWRHESRRPARI